MLLHSNLLPTLVLACSWQDFGFAVSLEVTSNPSKSWTLNRTHDRMKMLGPACATLQSQEGLMLRNLN